MTNSPFQLYVNYFETPFMRDMSKYYMIEATGCINTLSVGEFMRRTGERLKSEAISMFDVFNKKGVGNILRCQHQGHDLTSNVKNYGSGITL
jgi:hypothetical protein